MKRRGFLRTGAGLLGAGLLGHASRALGDEGNAPAAATDETTVRPDIVLARGEGKEATHAALAALGGMSRFVAADQVVVIKPNSSFATQPDLGATTHPDVLFAVVEACLEAGARRVLVVDHIMPGQRKCFERNGTADVLADLPKTKLVSLDNQKSYKPVTVEAGKALHETEIPAIMQKADVFINLPTAKSHAATDVSLGFKNLMGLVWDRQSFHRDFDIHQGIADLGTVLRPQLTIIDAMRILTTGGPTGPGNVDTFDGVVAGVDPVAVDAYGVGLSTWNDRTYQPNQIAHLGYAAEHGLGTLELDGLRIQETG